MAVIALVALIIIGPKDLPRAMRTISQYVRKARGIMREFQSGVDEMIREADLEDARKAVQKGRNLDPKKMISDTIDPTGEVESEARDLEATARRDDTSGASASQATPAAASDAKSADAEPAGNAGSDEEPKASVIRHPVQVAPAHSIRPPSPPATDVRSPETSVSGGEPQAASGSSSQKSA